MQGVREESMTELLTLRQAEQRTQIKERTWRKWAAERRVTFVRLGRAIRISSEEIDRLCKRGTVAAVDVEAKAAVSARGRGRRSDR